MPTKLMYKLTVAFCVMSLLPNLVAVYIALVFLRTPFDFSPMKLLAVSAMLGINLLLSLFGLFILRGIANPIAAVTASAKSIAKGNLNFEPSMKGADEIEDLSQSLKVISQNARELLEKVEKLSQKDRLTGLYTATYIQERLGEEIERAVYLQRPCAFAYVDVDRFDKVTEKYGQKSAEEALKIISYIFSKHLSQFDRAARIMDDEFAIIFPDRNKKKAIEIVQKICTDIAAYTGYENGEALSVCVGISENPIDGVSSKDLYTMAQRRLKVAKARGFNQVEALA